MAMRDRQGEARGRPAPTPAEEEREDLLGRVRRRADGVRAEDRQRLASWTGARRSPRPVRGACPMRTARTLASARAPGVVGMLAASLAVSVPSPEYRKYGACGRSTRTRRSPGLRPCRGRRPPITGRTPVRSTSRSGRLGAAAASPPGRPRCRRPRAASAPSAAAGRGSRRRRPGSPSRGWPTLPGLSSARRSSRSSASPSAGLTGGGCARRPQGDRDVGVTVQPERRRRDGGQVLARR